MWLRDEFFITVLSKLTYVDLDSRVKNEEKLPLGIKRLNERLCIETQRQMDDEDWDSWTCNDGLAYTIKHCEWYQFYDCVEAVGDELKSVEPFYLDAPGFVDFSKFTFDAYRAKVNAILAKHQIDWRLNSRSQLESALPKIWQTALMASKKILISSTRHGSILEKPSVTCWEHIRITRTRSKSR